MPRRSAGSAGTAPAAGRASASGPACTPRLLLQRLLRPVHRARVPRHGNALRTVVREQLEQHVREAEQRARRLPVGRGELFGQREERAVGEVVAVDDEEIGVARRRVVQLQLGSGQRFRHSPRVSSSPHGEPRDSSTFRSSRRGREPARRAVRAPARRRAAPAGRAPTSRRSCRRKGMSLPEAARPSRTSPARSTRRASWRAGSSRGTPPASRRRCATCSQSRRMSSASPASCSPFRPPTRH